MPEMGIINPLIFCYFSVKSNNIIYQYKYYTYYVGTLDLKHLK